MTAQRRPGRSPRRHPRVGLRVAVAGDRSTKAGAFTPATRQGRGSSPRPQGALNEGRGVHPGDTSGRAAARRSASTLNEGRGVHPGDTVMAPTTGVPGSLRSTKAGAFTPATHADLSAGALEPGHAQRRPGRSPRRHRCPLLRRGHRLDAQRRPGRSPRRHVVALRKSRLQDPIAQRRPGRSPRRHQTAIAAVEAERHAQRRPGRSPRRHRRLRRSDGARVDRSTKAGAFTPATLSVVERVPLVEGRSTKAGAFTPATRARVRVRARLAAARSTKAGAFTPATPGWSRRVGPPDTTLNEGRGVHPGDTR